MVASSELKLKDLIISLMKIQHFDSIAVGVLDFSTHHHQFKTFEFKNHKQIQSQQFFDLASITKALTNGVVALKYPHLFAYDGSGEKDDFNNLKLLLNHQAGLPRGGRLSKSSWRQDILGYKINSVSSPTLYSDYSAIRFMLEIEKRSQKSYKELLSDEKGFLGGEENGIYFWKDLPSDLKANAVETGERNGKIIKGEVNDDNAFVIEEFLSHAGLFATIDSLCKTLIYLDQKYNLLFKMKEEFVQLSHLSPSSQQTLKQMPRFIAGWDRVEDLEKTLAGVGASSHTFGHLGFTGTSCWIDLEKNFGQVILTNATQKYSYSRENLNLLRREIGKYFWNNGKSILN